MTREINSADWPEFCQRLTQQRANATVKLETVEPDGIKNELVAGATFQSVAFTKSDGCSDSMTLRVRGAREIVHEIVEPIQVRLHPSGTHGDFNTLQIEAESGMLFLTFHPAIHEQMLAGLKAG
jgi:hypothetical protein